MYFDEPRPVIFREMTAAFFGALLVLCCCSSPCVAGSYVVTNTNDSGSGSFRQAILDLNAAADASNTITFNMTGTITLASKLARVAENVAFVNGSGVTVVLPAVGTGSFLEGLVMNGGGGTTFTGDMPSMSVTGGGVGDFVLGVGGPVLVFGDDLSGAITVTSGRDVAYGVYGSTLTMKDISGTVSAEAGRDESIGLLSDSTLAINGDVSGTLTATSGLDRAAALNAPDIDIAGDVSGVLKAHAGQDSSYGITTDELDVQGDISGTMTATAGRDGAFGVYTVDELIVRGMFPATLRPRLADIRPLGLLPTTGSSMAETQRLRWTSAVMSPPLPMGWPWAFPPGAP